jgi:hypothetical protein
MEEAGDGGLHALHHVQPLPTDHIISLEDGKPYKSLKRHLTGRGLNPAQYREKWAFARIIRWLLRNTQNAGRSLRWCLVLAAKAAKEPAEAAPEPKARKRKSAPKSAPKAAPKGSVKRSKRKS